MFQSRVILPGVILPVTESVDSLQRRVGHIFSCLPGGVPDFHEFIRLCAQGWTVQTMIALLHLSTIRLMHIALHWSPHSLNKLKFPLPDFSFRSIGCSRHVFDRSTLFMAVQFSLPWCFGSIIGVGVVMLLRFDSTMPGGKPWPCCVQLVRKSAQKIASEPLPFYPCEVTLTSNSSSPFASVGLFELSFTLMTLGSSCGGGHQAHFTGAAKQLR